MRSRRGRGEASIFRRKSDGLWVGTVSLGYDGNGKRKRKTVYGATKAEALDELAKVRAEARVGNLPDAGNLTVAQLLDQWMKATQAKAAVRTFEERERLVKKHLKPRVGSIRLSKLTALHVEGLYGEMHADKIGPFAIRSAADVLSIALNYAVRLRLIPSSAAAAVPKPKIPKSEKTFLNDAQARHLLDAARGSPVFPLLVLALATGCRQGELLALGWDEIDLKAGTLTVRKSLAQTKAGFLVKEPKNPASRRVIRLPAFAVEVLTTQKAAAFKAGSLASPVFCTRTGNYLDKKNVIRAFRTAVKKANNKAGEVLSADPRPVTSEDTTKIPEQVRFHDLRHTVASLLLSTGHSLRAVAQRLGHADPAMTLRVYAHCLPNDDAQLAAGLDKAFA